MTERAPVYQAIYDLTNASVEDWRLFELKNRSAQLFARQMEIRRSQLVVYAELEEIMDGSELVAYLENRIANCRAQIAELNADYTELCGKLQQELIKAE